VSDLPPTRRVRQASPADCCRRDFVMGVERGAREVAGRWRLRVRGPTATLPHNMWWTCPISVTLGAIGGIVPRSEPISRQGVTEMKSIWLSDFGGVDDLDLE
jgi:hypothetical protein